MHGCDDTHLSLAQWTLPSGRSWPRGGVWGGRAVAYNTRSHMAAPSVCEVQVCEGAGLTIEARKGSIQTCSWPCDGHAGLLREHGTTLFYILTRRKRCVLWPSVIMT
jgi:hypothetical protein